MHQFDSREDSKPPETPARRDFLKKASAVVLGGLAMAAPVAAGVLVVFDPLREKGDSGALVHVAPLQAVPEDGLPRKFVIVASHSDAWNRNPHVPVGAVYLRRTGAKTVEAFNVVCPHAGCFVDFVLTRRSFVCPCHNSVFTLEGKIGDPRSPSPRGLDTLEVEIRNESEVWVRFQNYLAGHDQKIPVA